MAHQTNPSHPKTVDAERLWQAFSSFAARMAKSEDPVAKDAARRLQCELKAVKIENDNS